MHVTSQTNYLLHSQSSIKSELRVELKKNLFNKMTTSSRKTFIEKAENGTGIIVQKSKRTFEIRYKKDEKIQKVLIKCKRDGLHLTDKTEAVFNNLDQVLHHIGVQALRKTGEQQEKTHILNRAKRDLKDADIGTVKLYSRKKHSRWQTLTYVAIKEKDGIHLHARQHKKSRSLPNLNTVVPHSAVFVASGQERIWEGTDPKTSTSLPILLGSMREGKKVTDHEKAIHRRFKDSERLNTVSEFTTSDDKKKYIIYRMTGDLRQALTFDRNQKLEIFLEVCKGLKELHDADVIHRDLKLGNVLIDIDETNPSQSRVQIGDFGLSLSYNETENEKDGIETPTGSLQNAGSDGYLDVKYLYTDVATKAEGKAADIYSLGVLLQFLMQGNEENSISMDLLFKVALGGFEGISDEDRDNKIAAFNGVVEKAIHDPEIRSIISKMVCFEELGETRLTIDGVIEEVQKVLLGVERIE